LLFAVLRRRLGLVSILEGAVVALVEPPVALDGDPHEVHHVEHEPEVRMARLSREV